MGNFFKSLLYTSPSHIIPSAPSASSRLTMGAINNSNTTAYNNDDYNDYNHYNEGSCFKGICTTLGKLFKGGTRRKKKHLRKTIKRIQRRH